MKTLVTQGKRVLNLFMLFVLTSTLVQAQQLSLVHNESTLTVLGTSNIHDWHLEAESQTGTIKFKNLETCQLEALTLSIEAEGLVSGKKSMDTGLFFLFPVVTPIVQFMA